MMSTLQKENDLLRMHVTFYETQIQTYETQMRTYQTQIHTYETQLQSKNEEIRSLKTQVANGSMQPQYHVQRQKAETYGC
jgi:hypothetical protein